MIDFNDRPASEEKAAAALAHALAYAAAGTPVFPCNPMTKAPLLANTGGAGEKGGFHAATTNPLQIKAWWAKWPNAMIGAPTGKPSGFVVLDIDQNPAAGKHGAASIEAFGHPLAELFDHPHTQTAGGGYHIFFAYDPDRPLTNARGSLPPHVDIRGDGGYVILAGSRTADGRAYTAISPLSETPPTPAPEWLHEAVRDPHHSTISPNTSPLDFNTAQRLNDNAAARAAGPIPPGQWHDRTRDLVARMVREGSSDETIFAIAPRFTDTAAGYTDNDTVRDFAAHIRTARAKWGYVAAAQHETPAPADPATPQPEGKPLRFKILSLIELTNVKAPEWRIDGIFPSHGSSVIYGAFETFKTFIALDMTLAAAAGRDWFGRATKPCPVLYIAGEGQVGLGIRAKGWLHARGLDAADVQFQGLPEAVALPSPGDQDDLLRAIDAMPFRPEIIVLDTVTRMTGGGSLNDEKDAQAYVRGMDRLRIQTGAHIMNIGHAGKDKERGILGSTVLPAAMETIICVERKGPSLTLINSNPKGKQKDGPNFDDIRLATRIHHFEHDGADQTTVLLTLDEDVVKSDKPSPPRRLGAVEKKILAALEQAARQGQGLGFTRLRAMAEVSDPGTLRNALSTLVEKDMVHVTGEQGSQTWKLP